MGGNCGDWEIEKPDFLADVTHCYQSAVGWVPRSRTQHDCAEVPIPVGFHYVSPNLRKQLLSVNQAVTWRNTPIVDSAEPWL